MSKSKTEQQDSNPKNSKDMQDDAHQDGISDETQQAEDTVEHDLEAMLAEAEQEAASQKELALRTLADMENLKRRTRMDVENAHKFALEKFVNELLPVLDSMEMGLDAAAKEDASAESIREGLDMTFKLFLDVMQKFNVERVNPEGEKFDPQLHEAMTMVPSPDHESQMVMEVFQKGYLLNERLVRPARVIVAQ
ncbi:MAG: nucleotide exchange factor GrpE [Piscirickettsiaceae bacterium CG_4_9_14_3_um_filter_43_564]|nr:nucleotide exchange factor GrpE [Thiomicrospira sp.]OIP96808.1 MAG: nucleotide exchange factor GrpE [Thiomicrospira sp. CG2_30_44_34]PIQ04704.1 MAG: nucleotide exchange factor GrpE [Piscirickettsiaceae bacterium CG18_big_fil_WC_8_21_14_2_50_44_103]PIU39358.1 MAG: nucleotide exchange factor GrpE [Piscirickettsiaceae bacterium CG07_land_8_20_14_0_80_44_28]PIW56740.1 MAG: nucleotide exchange factor GrpE [Piscirickettsiaceae bacterium CG12_big_fil_rev_8_21_14_0_65_44_934]PIW77805.1 MAG: nucleot